MIGNLFHWNFCVLWLATGARKRPQWSLWPEPLVQHVGCALSYRFDGTRWKGHYSRCIQVQRKVISMRSMNQRKSRTIDLDVNLSFPLLLECERDHCRVIVSDFAGSPEILAMLTIVMSEAWNSLAQNIMLSRRMELSSWASFDVVLGAVGFCKAWVLCQVVFPLIILFHDFLFMSLSVIHWRVLLYANSAVVIAWRPQTRTCMNCPVISSTLLTVRQFYSSAPRPMIYAIFLPLDEPDTVPGTCRVATPKMLPLLEMNLSQGLVIFSEEERGSGAFHN